MAFQVDLRTAQADYPEYKFIRALTPSEQKAAFLVEDQDGKQLCFKIINPNSDVDRVGREIDALVAIDHINVVSLLEYRKQSRPGKFIHYMIEEFVDGSDLSDFLVLGQAMSLDEAAPLFASLCDGLGALKLARIVHRDLKPSNIRVRPDMSPVIIDLGLARLLTKPDLTATGDGAKLGSPAYFAPEQWQGTKHDIDHRTDLFATGILLYQAIVGAHPFWTPGVKTIDELKDAACGSRSYLDHPMFKSLPEGWRLLISKLLEVERARRPADADQVAKILRKIGATK